MPEVFLKTVAIARNLGFSLDGMTTANLDFQQQYRGRLNVLDRPGGVGVALTGHHDFDPALARGSRRPNPGRNLVLMRSRRLQEVLTLSPR